ncbi:VanZ family protein [Formosa sp. PL04]|uniref:VanZ family protein n=1 Tax=Formosa sp. PL04 TaxID=3081755 RepID=UPI002981E178|nr:VanZ family protein [Formosa sp. PL04]MDW5287329.1 VanZ family protein [Formosa sp. PL04]
MATLSLVNLGNITKGSPKNSDKVFHFLAYCLLCLVWYMVFKHGYKWPLTKALLTTGLVSISFGVLIEYLQGSLTETRQFDVLDILANSAGVILMLLILTIKNKTKFKLI